jgi:hypothetical protein
MVLASVEPSMAVRFPSPAKGPLKPLLEPSSYRGKQPSEVLLGRIDLTDVSVDPTPDEDGLVAEISASVSFANRLFTISSGGSDRVTLTDWSDPTDPQILEQLELSGYFTTSVATFGNLIAIAATPDDYDNPSNTSTPVSKVLFYSLTSTGELTALDEVETGFLTDGMRFSEDGSHLYIANEGQPNADYSVDPVGSVSIINISRTGNTPTFSGFEVTFPDLNASGVELLGSGIRFSGKSTVTDTFAQDAEPEYVSAAGGHLFVTLQENNTVARINLDSNQVEAYIGLGWVDYSLVSVDLDDEDGPGESELFNPLAGQEVAGLRMADGIAAWAQGNNVYFITANEGDSREYDGYVDEERNEDLGYSGIPDRLKLIVDGNDTDDALVLHGNPGDNDPTNDFSFEDTSGGSPTRTPVSFGSRSLSLFDGITGELLWDSWMTDFIDGIAYNTSLQNIAVFADVYDYGRSDDKGVEPESVIVLEYRGRTYAVGALERTTAGDKTGSTPDPVAQGGLLVVYDVTEVSNVDFVTYQEVSRSPEGLEVIYTDQSPTSRVLLGVSAEFDSNSVEFLDFGALLNNGKGANYLDSELATDLDTYVTL